MVQPPSQPQRGTQEPDPKCVHSTPQEFFHPPRTDDSRTDFFAAYRKGYEEFDRDYAKKYDEDLNTTLIFAGLFSAVSTTFVTSVQPELEQDPNDVTAVYMQILIHTMNNTLFPDADPSSTAWTGPPREIVVVQSLLYASLAISLFAAFLAMLGKQWINRYLRNCDGSTAKKGRDRQRKLDGHDKWYFYIAIESLPMMLQFAVLLFGCALSLYLWTISRAVAWIVLSFTLAGATAYVFFTIAATVYYNCPYQTPPSMTIRTLARYLKHSNSAFVCSMRYRMASLAESYSRSVKKLGQILKRLRSGVRSALQNFGCIPNPPGGMEQTPLAAVRQPWHFGEIHVDREVGKADARCISWMLNFTTDSDVAFYGARFATDTVWHPKIAGIISPHILAKPFFECLSYGRVIPGKLEHASVIGMALASVLSIQLCMGPEREDLQRLSGDIRRYVNGVSESEPTFVPGVGVLRFVLETPFHATFREWDNTSDHLPTAHKLCLSRVILQTIWRWKRIPTAPAVFNLDAIDLLCKGLMANGGHSQVTLKIHCLLILAISMGHQVDDINTLFIPDDDRALRGVTHLLGWQLLTSIEGTVDQRTITSVLSALIHFDPIELVGPGDSGFSWITKILNSRYPEGERYQMASHVVRLLGKQLDSDGPGRISCVNGTWADPLARFLSLCEKFHTTDSPPYPGSIALRLLSVSPESAGYGGMILPVLTWTLLPTHPLQWRGLALKIFHTFGFGWFSPQMQIVSDEDLGKFLQVVGDPFQYTPDLPLQDGNPAGPADYDPMNAAVVLIKFASSDLWRKHLRPSNFTSCEDIVSREEGRAAFRKVLDTLVGEWSGLSRRPTKITTAIERLKELQCLNTVEVVITWAQDRGIGSPEDHEGWKSARA